MYSGTTPSFFPKKVGFLISQRATFYQSLPLQFPLRGLGGIRLLSTSGVRRVLISNHLKNNSKKIVEIFCQFKKKLYFCTRFRKGSEFIKIGQKIFLKKDLVVSKKGCTFAPAFKTSERSERD